jgi:hypothetical protein
MYSLKGIKNYMNKNEVIKKLSEMSGYDLEICEKANSIMEENGLIGHETKDKIICLFCQEFNMDEEEANDFYDTFCSIITEQIANKFFHPFSSKNSQN